MTETNHNGWMIRDGVNSLLAPFYGCIRDKRNYIRVRYADPSDPTHGLHGDYRYDRNLELPDGFVSWPRDETF